MLSETKEEGWLGELDRWKIRVSEKNFSTYTTLFTLGFKSQDPFHLLKFLFRFN